MATRKQFVYYRKSPWQQGYKVSAVGSLQGNKETMCLRSEVTMATRKQSTILLLSEASIATRKQCICFQNSPWQQLTMLLLSELFMVSRNQYVCCRKSPWQQGNNKSAVGSSHGNKETMCLLSEVSVATRKQRVCCHKSYFLIKSACTVVETDVHMCLHLETVDS